MLDKIKFYSEIITGINKGSQVYLHLLKELSEARSRKRRIAFFHRNTSDSRKKQILEDLQLPLGSEEKELICVVATISLGTISFVIL